jgi:phospholipid/cholesterol/gamma-HCH transport system substrate-binding protein
MSQNNRSVVRLGLFVLSALFLLVFALYLIGKSKNMFGSTVSIKTRFKNANGLMIGNNIYFSGLQAGTVKDIKLLNATTVEVTMLIEERMVAYIHRSATVSIGTEGLIGSKAINITPGSEPDLPIHDGDLLVAEKAIDRSEMLLTLSKTNINVEDVSAELSILVHRVNSSRALWGILNDGSLSPDITRTLNNLSRASGSVNRAAGLLDAIVSDVKAGKGAAGTLLADTAFENSLKQAVSKISALGDKASGLADEFSSMAGQVRYDIQNGPGTVHALLTDSAMAAKLSFSLDHIDRGTEAFDENMEALKHNFLVRGYFRRLEKKQRDSLKIISAADVKN